MKLTLIRLAGRLYLPVYDAAMRISPKWGPVALGYGPIVLAILAFLFKSRLFDSWMDPDTATVLIFVAFGLTGPVMHVGTRILAERMTHKTRGAWPAPRDPRFDPRGRVSPTEHWVEMLREDLRGA